METIVGGEDELLVFDSALLSLEIRILAVNNNFRMKACKVSCRHPHFALLYAWKDHKLLSLGQ